MEEDCAARKAWLTWISEQAELQGCQASQADTEKQLLAVVSDK